MATPVITHAKVSSGTVNAAVEVDLHDWNNTHAVTGLENVANVDTTNADNITGGSQTGTGALVRGTHPSFNNVVFGYTTTATAAGTTTLTVNSNRNQFFTGVTTQTVTLPVASTMTLGDQFFIQNNSTGLVTVQSSGANTVAILAGSASTLITCILISGTTAASWQLTTNYTSINGGKLLSVAATLTLTGTDGTTQTFPTTSATIARTDAAQTFTGVQTLSSQPILSSLTASSAVATDGSKGLVSVTNTGSGSNVLATSPALVTPSLGAATATTINGSTVSPGQYTGETTTGSASAGNIGEYVESIVVIGSAVSLVSSTPKTVTSITFGAGDWEVDLVAQFFPANTTSFTQLSASMSLVTNTLDTTPGRFFQVPQGTIVSTGASTYSVGLPDYRFSVSGSTTVFLVVQSTFTVSTETAFGIIRARRAR